MMINVACRSSILLVVIKLVIAQYSVGDFRDKSNTTVEIGVFLSSGVEGDCIKAAVLMAQDRIILSINNTAYHVLPKFKYLSADEEEAILEINSFVDDLPIRQAPAYYLGSPRNEQNEWISNIALGRSGLFPIPVITYSGKRESLQFDFKVEVSPTVYQMFEGSIELLRHFNWSKVGVIHDASFNEYKEVSGYLHSLLKSANLTILSKVIFFSEQDIKQEIDQLEKSNSRIIFGLFSIKGARKVFCEAFKRRMYDPVAVWILFEGLPNGWAGSKFDPTEGREISCTEDELLFASSGYLFFEKSSMLHNRNDSVLDELNVYLRNITNDGSVDAEKYCPPNTLYAYDSMILSGELYGEFIKEAHKEVFFSMQENIKITKISVQGLTGKIQFFHLKEWEIYARSTGLFNLFKASENSRKELFGTFAVDEDRNHELILASDVVDILFTRSRRVPNDSPFVKTVHKYFGTSTLWTMWGLAFAGIAFVLILFCINIVYTVKVSFDRNLMIADQTLFLGAVLCYASVIVYGLDPRFVEVADVAISCRAFTISLTFGVSLFLGSILIRIWKMYKLSLESQEEDGDEKTKKDPKTGCQWSIFIMLGIILLGDVIILTTWFSRSDFTTAVQDVSSKPVPIYQSLTVTKTHLIRCECQDRIIYTLSLYCYKGLLMIIGVFLFWETHISGKSSDNLAGSKDLGMAVCNMLVVSTVAAICTYILHDAGEYDSVYIILSLCIFISITASLILVFSIKLQRLLCGDSTSTPKKNPSVYKPKRKDMRQRNMTSMT